MQRSGEWAKRTEEKGGDEGMARKKEECGDLIKSGEKD
jgi:hypothetical protein